MATQTEDIAGLVQSVIRPLIDHEDDLVIDARETEDGSIFVEVRVNEEDAGKVIGHIGRYNPLTEPAMIKIDLEKCDKWLANGAQPTDTVAALIKKFREQA